MAAHIMIIMQKHQQLFVNFSFIESHERHVSLTDRLTLDGKLNSLRKPKSSPVASSLRSLVSEAALTKLSVGHIPSQVGPRTDVQLAQSSFSNWEHRNMNL